MSTSLLAALAALVPAYLAWSLVRDHRRRKGIPLPPGPRALPILGNVLDLTPTEMWLRWVTLLFQTLAL
jgi:hypothetical protein